MKNLMLETNFNMEKLQEKNFTKIVNITSQIYKWMINCNLLLKSENAYDIIMKKIYHITKKTQILILLLFIQNFTHMKIT